MIKTLYVGIDVSKDKLDCTCVSGTASPLTHSIFNNNKDGFENLQFWAEKLMEHKQTDRIHYCMEATGIYSYPLSKFLFKQKKSICSVVNPAQIKAFSRTQLIRTKTDKVDSKIIAKYCLIHNPQKYIQPKANFEKIKQLQRYLEHLINNRARERIFLESCLDKDIKSLTEENIAFLSIQIKKVEKQIKEKIDKDASIKNKVDLIKSIPGLGDKSAWAILTELHPKDKINIKSQVAHAGLAPMQRQSGKSVNGKPRICKTGNPRLRKCLYMPAVSTIRSQSAFGDYYRHLVQKGKAKKVAITAVMRKLLVTALGVLKNDLPYDPCWVKNKQKAFYQLHQIFT